MSTTEVDNPLRRMEQIVLRASHPPVRADADCVPRSRSFDVVASSDAANCLPAASQQSRGKRTGGQGRTELPTATVRPVESGNGVVYQKTTTCWLQPHADGTERPSSFAVCESSVNSSAEVRRRRSVTLPDVPDSSAVVVKSRRPARSASTIDNHDDDDPVTSASSQPFDADLPSVPTELADSRSVKAQTDDSVASSTHRRAAVSEKQAVRRSGGPHQRHHPCSVCRKPFSSASALQIHSRTHTGVRPFRCDVCSKTFTTKGNLKVHAATHGWPTRGAVVGGRLAPRRGRRVGLPLPPLHLPAVIAASAQHCPMWPAYIYRHALLATAAGHAIYHPVC